MLNHNLKMFLAVVRNGGITEAANSLYISQPAVSQAIKSLEQALNVKLFYRDRKHGVVLTEVCEKIRLLALEMEHLEDQLYQTAYLENHFIGGNLRIGSLPVLTATLLPDPLFAFREKYPQVNVSLAEGSPRELRRMVEDRSIDLALSCSPFGKLDHEVLIHDKMVGIQPVGAENLDQIDLRHNTEKLILVRAGSETSNESLIGRLRLDFSKNILTTNGSSVVSLVKSGVGSGVISEYTLDAIDPGMKRVPVVPEIRIDIGVQCCDLKDLTPVAAEFVRMLAEYTALKTARNGS